MPDPLNEMADSGHSRLAVGIADRGVVGDAGSPIVPRKRIEEIVGVRMIGEEVSGQLLDHPLNGSCLVGQASDIGLGLGEAIFNVHSDSSVVRVATATVAERVVGGNL